MEEKENYFSCDYCHRVGTGITIVNGFKMCPMCLAEYQHKSGENNELREELGKKAREVEQLKKENEKLKEALQEKVESDKLFLKELKGTLKNSENEYKKLLSQCENKLKSAQNKLAIEKLEELSDIINENIHAWVESGKSKYGWLDFSDTTNKLDTMLAELKEQAEEALKKLVGEKR